MKTKIISFSLLLFLFTSPTKAQNWEFVGLDSFLVKQIYISGDTIWAGTDTRINTNLTAGVYQSTNGGNTWNHLDSALGDGTSVCFYKDNRNNFLYLIKGATEWSIAGTLYKSTDLGKNWELIQQLENIPIDWINISPFDEYEMYVKESYFFPSGWYETVHRSLDGGTDWQEITSSFPSSSHGRNMAFNLSFTQNDKLYGVVNDRLIDKYFFVSNNSGNSWSYVSEPPTVEQELITDPVIINRIFMFTGYYLSDDGGYNWEIADSGLQDVNSYLTLYIDPRDNQTYLNLRKDGLYVSKNKPINWKLIEGSNNLPLNIGSYGFINEDIGQLRNVFIDTLTKVLYVGTASGIYKKNVITVVRGEKNYKPSEFILEQNYPNPFNPSTMISYQIPEKSFVIVRVYDVLGNEINTIVSEEKLPGEYQVDFSGKDLTSGVYFYVLTAEANNNALFRRGKKMLLIK
jgi:hypothetical protein